MTSQAKQGAGAGDEQAEEARGTRFLRRAARFWLTEDWLAAWLLTGAFIFFLFASFGAKYAANAWSKFFFDALEQLDGPKIWSAIWLIVAIVFASALASVLLIHAQTRLKLALARMAHKSARRPLAGDRRFYKLSTLHHAETPEARIAEDGRIAIELFVDLAGGVVLSIIVAIGFIGVLWTTAGSIKVMGYEIPATWLLRASCIRSSCPD